MDYIFLMNLKLLFHLTIKFYFYFYLNNLKEMQIKYLFTSIVKNSVIFRNVKIQKNAVVENCIIGDNSIVEEGVHLKNIILEADCRISRDTTLISSPENPMIIS
ncbi:hypothetical protein EOM09_04385 [bacterium]|nr:hypothetical protein [bacterium]